MAQTCLPSFLVCSLRVTNATIKPLHSPLCLCLSVIRKIFCIVSWTSTKHESFGIHQRPWYIRNRVLLSANMLRRSRRLSHGPESWWPPFCEIHKCDLTEERQNGHKALLFKCIHMYMNTTKLHASRAIQVCYYFFFYTNLSDMFLMYRKYKFNKLSSQWQMYSIK